MESSLIVSPAKTEISLMLQDTQKTNAALSKAEQREKLDKLTQNIRKKISNFYY